MPRELQVTPTVVKQALALRAQGFGVREAAERLGVGKTQLAEAMKVAEAKAAPAPAKVKRAAAPAERPPSPPPPPGAIDATGTPLQIARAMLASLTSGMADLDADSPAYVRLSAEGRQCAKLIAALEREEAGKETAEEAVKRQRRESAATRKAIERYTNQALAIALRQTAEAPHGQCPTCAHPLTADSRAALTGGT
jgi:hypothetical protein